MFRLGAVENAEMIPEGMMNRNWRLVTARGVFCLRRILDVDLPTARRNLAVLAALAEDDLPVRPALPAPGGTLVAEAAGHGYCVFPWTDGVHIPGVDLTAQQAGALGALLARLHYALLRATTPPPAPGPPPNALLSPAFTPAPPGSVSPRPAYASGPTPSGLVPTAPHPAPGLAPFHAASAPVASAPMSSGSTPGPPAPAWPPAADKPAASSGPPPLCSTSASQRRPRPAAVEPPEHALARTGHLLDQISSIRSPQTADLTFLVHLRRRIHLLRRYGALRPAHDRPLGPYGWTHGDLRPDNLLWRDAAIAAVIDWDRLAVRPQMEELARAALALFTHEDGAIDLPRVAAFTNGYRSIAPVDERALADSVRRVWWTTMCDNWHLEYYYGHCCGHPHRSGPGALDWWLNACGRAFVRDSRMLDWWTRHWQDVRDAFAGHHPSTRALAA
ncbi:hypothetical protein GCM10022214_62470 [Actinomadura miaoliensis]|uniref:Aminoglycoside phosphotransferase domain-containing protein n=2 Tax=Actinomadura miaoliensis TaxID=430685 RepID=A0ABP7WML4_9ACTN